MPCKPLSSLTGCLGSAHGASHLAASGGASSGWDGICQSFARAAQQLLSSFAKSFTSIPPIDLSYSGVRSVYGLSLEIAAVVAVLLLMVQVIRMVLIHDGSALTQGLTGIGKAALAFALTLGAAATAVRASDELSAWIVSRTFGSPAALSARLGHLVSFSPKVSASLMFILALTGMLITLALWAQLLIRNVAVTAAVAISPVAAAGQIAHGSQAWWRKLLRATIQLIVLKPVVALIFAVGLTLPGSGGKVEKLLSGMLVLLLAAVAWPAMARATAALEVYVTGGALASLRGGGGDRGAPGRPGGVSPSELSRVAEARTMAAVHEMHTRSIESRRDTHIRSVVPVAASANGRTGPGSSFRNDGGFGPAGSDGTSPEGASRLLASPSRAGQEASPGGDRSGDVLPAVPGGPARAATDTDGTPRLTGLEPGHSGAPGAWRNR